MDRGHGRDHALAHDPHKTMPGHGESHARAFFYDLLFVHEDVDQAA